MPSSAIVIELLGTSLDGDELAAVRLRPRRHRHDRQNHSARFLSDSLQKTHGVRGSGRTAAGAYDAFGPFWLQKIYFE